MIDLLLDVGDSSVLLGDELAVNHGDSLDTEGREGHVCIHQLALDIYL